MPEKILIVDDEPDVLTYFTTLLEEAGYQVFQADNADEALRLAKKEMPQLICLDIMMPKKSGLAFYKELKQLPELKDIPIAIVSALISSREFSHEFRKYVPERAIPEPELIIDKPIKPNSFVEKIQAELARKK